MENWIYANGIYRIVNGKTYSPLDSVAIHEWDIIKVSELMWDLIEGKYRYLGKSF
jgi:hypothetical protein